MEIKILSHEGDWYWIPTNLVEGFTVMSNNISEVGYMDNPDMFDGFDADYGKYATGGDMYNTPDEFKGKQLKISIV